MPTDSSPQEAGLGRPSRFEKERRGVARSATPRPKNTTGEVDQ